MRHGGDPPRRGLAIADYSRTLKVGDSSDPATQVGPLVSPEQLDRVTGYLAMDPAVPFGGYKMSGYGRESGKQHVEEYLKTA